MAPNKSTEPSEADIIFTRASVALAKSQRLIASWLPPRTDAETERDADYGDEEDDFRVEVGGELLGVGATPPSSSTDGILRKGRDPSLDALRKQLLGRHAPRPETLRNTTAPVILTRKPPVIEDSDSDEGRTAAFTSKTEGRKEQVKTSKPQDDDEIGGGDAEEAAVVVQSPKKRKATSYLDEILAEKSAKKKKKKKGGNVS